MTVFQKIIDGEIPVEFVYEDEHCIVIHDQNPQAPVHMLVIPRKAIAMLEDAESQDEMLLGHLLWVSQTVAKSQGLETGFRVVINNGSDACQTVHHLHIHVLGGRGFAWPPG